MCGSLKSHHKDTLGFYGTRQTLETASGNGEGKLHPLFFHRLSFPSSHWCATFTLSPLYNELARKVLTQNTLKEIHIEKHPNTTIYYQLILALNW